MPLPTTATILPTSTSTARPTSRGWAIAGILLLASAITGACDVDEERLETFRDGGCGAGREIGFGDLICEYKGGFVSESSAAVASATCDGSDELVCEFSIECEWRVSSTGTCRDACEPRDPSLTRHSVRVTLPDGNTQCDPPDPMRNQATCRSRLQEPAVMDALKSSCWNSRDTVVEEDLVCCVDKPKRKGPCAEDEACDGSDAGMDGSDDGSVSDGPATDTADPSGGEPCPADAEMVCDVASPDGELACRCAVAS